MTSEPPENPRSWFDSLFGDEEDDATAAGRDRIPSAPATDGVAAPDSPVAPSGEPVADRAERGAADDDLADGSAAKREPGPTPLSRRSALTGGLIGAAAVAAAAVGGVAVGRAHRPSRSVAVTKSPPRPVPVPAVLADAIRAEESLLAAASAALSARPGPSPAQAIALRQIRTDHSAHLAALRAALPSGAIRPTLAKPTGQSPSPTSTGSGSPGGSAVTVADVRASEAQAARQGAVRAASASGALGPLLASIAACEASHRVALA